MSFLKSSQESPSGDATGMLMARNRYRSRQQRSQ
jgi:hypothetical protein